MNSKIKLVLHLSFGSMDSLTGLALLVAPVPIMGLIGIPIGHPSVEPFLRFVGCFVAAIGSSYFIPLWFRKSWRFQWLFSAWVRTGVAIGLFVLIVAGSFPWIWISIVLTDLTVAGIQCLWLRSSDEE